MIKPTSSNTSRRDFLKVMGFTTTAAVLASCETPVIKSIPYVVKPEEVTPGIANFYASTFYDGHDYASVLVKTREGRPIKVDGNDAMKVGNTGTTARVQSSILSLYKLLYAKFPQDESCLDKLKKAKSEKKKKLFRESICSERNEE